MPAVVQTDCHGDYLIEYYVFDAFSGEHVRKRVKTKRLTNRLRTKREKQAFVQRMAEEINRRLEAGWSPLHEGEEARLYTPIDELRSRFLAAKRRDSLRETTLINYTSITGLFLAWCNTYAVPKKQSGTFRRLDAVRYMDYVAAKDNGNRSYNNTLKCLRCFFNWAIEHCYSKENPFTSIRTAPKTKKKRILIPADVRARIADYFRENKPAMELLCLLVYTSAIRPNEASKIQIRHIDMSRHCIIIPGENAKNKHTRCASLSPQLEELLHPIVAQNLPADWYLFGSGREISPGEKPCLKNYFGKCWVKMRRTLGLPEEMQLYSLRDTGLTELIYSGLDQLTVQHHADHSSLEIQSLYTDHYDPDLNNKIYKKAPRF